MRTIVLAGAAALLAMILAVPLAAASETWGRHSWEHSVGTREEGAGLSTDEGAAFVATSGFYVVSDGAPLLADFLFSIWIYQESNGQPGLQRWDEGCEDHDGTYEPDTGCFC